MQPHTQQADGVQDAPATGTSGTTEQAQAAPQAGATTSLVQTQTTAIPPTGKDPGQQVNSNSQAQAVVQAVVPSAEQWYQQQQQYQQYYQQYSGYNLYQQHYQQYYPYQQQAVPQYQQQPLQGQPQGFVQPQPQSQPQLHMQPQPQAQPQAQPQPQLQPAQPPPQAPVVTQPQSLTQVSAQQQTHPLPQAQPVSQTQSYPQVQAHSYTQAQGHPQPQAIQANLPTMQMPQYQQPLSQMQNKQPQIQHPIPQPQLQSQTQQQTQSQSHTHSQLNPALPNQTQTQHTSASAVTGHHSYPQPQLQPHQLMPMGGPQQHPMLQHPHSGSYPQIQNHYSQQTPQMRPPQPNATIPNQQQSMLLPLPGQVPNIPPAQQQPVYPHAHQPGVPGHQRSFVQPMQQPIPQLYGQPQPPFTGQYQQAPFAQQHPSVQSQLRPQGPPISFQQHSHPYSQPRSNVALLHGIQPHQSQNIVGRPMNPNHGAQSQPYQQSAAGLQGRAVQYGSNQPFSNQSSMLGSNNQMQVSSQKLSARTAEQTMSEKQEIAEKCVDEKKVEPSFQKTAKSDGNTLDVTSGSQADAVGMKLSKSESDVKFMVDEVKAEAEVKINPVDTSGKEFVTDLESGALGNAEPGIKQVVKEEIVENVEDHKDSTNVDCKQVGHSLLEEKKIQNGSLHKSSPLHVDSQCGEESEELQKGKNMLQGPALVPLGGQMQSGGSVQSPSTHNGSSTLQQGPTAPSMSQAPHSGPLPHAQGLGNPHTQFRPQGSSYVPHPGQSLMPADNSQPPMFKSHGPEIPPVGISGSGAAATIGRGPGHHGPPLHSLEPLTAPHGPYNQGHLPPSHFGVPRISQGNAVGLQPLQPVPPGAYDSQGPQYGPEGQRRGYLDGRRPDSHLLGSLERSPFGQPFGLQSNTMRMIGTSGLEFPDERFKPFPGEHLNPFPTDSAQGVIDRVELEEDLKKFPRPSHSDIEPVAKLGGRFPSSRPLDRGPHGFGIDVGARPYDRGLNHDLGWKLDHVSGSAPSKFLPSYAGERPPDIHEDAPRRSDSARSHLEFLGPGPGYGRRHMDGLSPRSPVREYPGISSRAFGNIPGNLGGSHARLDDIDGREFRQFGDPIGNSFHESRFPAFPSHFRRGEFEGPGRSGDFIGRDFLPNHLRRGEHLGPHNLRLGETVGLGGFPGHAHMADLGGPGNFPHPRLGEPGFRSSFSHQGFPSDGGFYTVKTSLLLIFF